MIKLKRVYDEPVEEDGYRILTERLWPRGVSKERANLDEWMKAVAPSHELRKWFDHDHEKWSEFKDRYRKELFGSETIQQLINTVEEEDVVTFVFASKDEEHNSTVVLKSFIEQLLSG
ncbi:DUF488 domain-containing protein [Gracilimonas sp. BCB1]|uniref:DUF488 domain-containing protein n=1 Tax=Gracilimonas sp. BCB1 TaxID=3152362 RepID=UPI0032D921CA